MNKLQKLNRKIIPTFLAFPGNDRLLTIKPLPDYRKQPSAGAHRLHPDAYLCERMRHLPNILTLANLFCGCAAITFILGAQNFTTTTNGLDFIEVPAMEQPYIGSLFIFAAAFFDLLDGASARLLKVFSPIGKDLDSLADLVSFGVAPSMMLFKMLWATTMMQPEAMDSSLWQLGPAFAVALFAAIRLARFNNLPASARGYHFIGMPTPATGLYVATLPLMQWYSPAYNYTLTRDTWSLYLLIGILSYLMVSKIRFFKGLPPQWNIKHLWPRLVLLGVTGAAIPFLGWGAADAALLCYILLAFVYKPTDTEIQPS